MRRRRALRDLEADIRDHIDRETEENIARGLPPREARRRALIAFGNVGLVEEDARAVWHWLWLEQIGQDAREALHGLRRRPGFAAIVILTLALAIGMNTAVFGVFSLVLLRPLHASRSDRW